MRTTWMDLEHIILSEINQSDKYGKCIHLYKVSKLVKLREAENRTVFSRDGGEGNGESFDGYKAIVTQDE